MAECPVCKARIPEPMPPLCDDCGWSLENDPTLRISLDRIPERTMETYRRQLGIAKRNWSRQIELERKLREQEASGRQRIDELERRLEEQAASQRQPEQSRQEEAELDEEILRYTDLIESDPNEAAFYRNRGIAYGKKGQYDLAVADYTRAISLSEGMHM